MSGAGRQSARLGWVLALLAAAACKVPITDIEAQFTLADATWFEQEQTLFFFWRLEAQQGIGELSQVEITYVTDDLTQPWSDVQALPQVHTHLPIDCGPNRRCGSASLKVDKAPRQVGMRLRYHRDGEVFLDASTTFNVVGVGPAHTHRSLVVYGVFDETNTRVQWRARHQFPTLRNHEVTELGLRRSLRILEPGVGPVTVPSDNPYGYGAAAGCPPGLAPLGWAELQTLDRAAFAAESLPQPASTEAGVCARSIVIDATGSFETSAVARKNPEVRPAFPTLRTPIRDALPVGFVLAPCNRVISQPHHDMQVQRLQLEGVPTACLDDVRTPGFATRLAGQFRAGIDAARASGRDMVLVLALHHDDTSGFTASAVEEALEQVVPVELGKTTPRVVGAFVFDSFSHQLGSSSLQRTVLWCPARLPFSFDGGLDLPLDGGLDDLDAIPDYAQRTCPLLPDPLELMLGPFSFTSLPILPTRAQYLTFVEKYSEGQAGHTTKLTFRAPERTPVSENIELGEFGVATFFNNESFPAAPGDAFSFCTPADAGFNPVVFRVPAAPQTPLPLATLPDVQLALPQPSYAIGLAWDFPFLTRLEYQVTFAGAATVVSVTVPFGISGMGMSYYGTPLWSQGEFSIAEWLAQCVRWCDHPTFDAAGVYNVTLDFRQGYKSQCYRPKYPTPDGGGFPDDP